MNLAESRKTIDEIDRSLVALLIERGRVSRQIAAVKAKANLPVTDEIREAKILGNVIAEGDGTITDDAIVEIYRIILRESRRIQTEAKSRVLVEEATA